MSGRHVRRRGDRRDEGPPRTVESWVPPPPEPPAPPRVRRDPFVPGPPTPAGAFWWVVFGLAFTAALIVGGARQLGDPPPLPYAAVVAGSAVVVLALLAAARRPGRRPPRPVAPETRYTVLVVAGVCGVVMSRIDAPPFIGWIVGAFGGAAGAAVLTAAWRLVTGRAALDRGDHAA